jgi:phosphonate transport system ATP-binding protein
MAKPVIDFQNVDLVYPNGFHALKNLNFQVEPGEFIAIIGRSGAGKSTLLRAINKTISLTKGNAKVLETNLSTITPRNLRKLRGKIGFVFQQFNLVKNLTVLQNVLHGTLSNVGFLRSMLGFYPKKSIDAAIQALKSVGLDSKLDSRVDALSGGQQQRVAIARAIVQNPDIILADEPMASLDPKLSEVVLQILVDFNRTRKMTTIVNLHVLELAQKFATRIVGMREGKIVFVGKPDELNSKALELIYEGAVS